MKVSLFGSCIRTDKWLNLYKELADSNSVEFELVFSGPRKPDFDLPSNFKYIYAKVKPSQCFSIAAREVSGEIVSIFGDDTSLSPGFLDKAYQCFLDQNDPLAVVTPSMYYQENWHLSGKEHYLISHNSNTPNVPQGLAFYDRDLFVSLNGFDKRFVAVLGDYDMFLRAKEKGAYLVFCENIWQRHQATQEKNQNYLYRNYKHLDRPLLYSFWIKDNNFAPKRLKPYLPFSYDDTIYTVTQEPQGWVERTDV